MAIVVDPFVYKLHYSFVQFEELWGLCFTGR
jgi:hypothetical protein